jgi:hypothetical protein
MCSLTAYVHSIERLRVGEKAGKHRLRAALIYNLSECLKFEQKKMVAFDYFCGNCSFHRTVVCVLFFTAVATFNSMYTNTTIIVISIKKYPNPSGVKLLK